MEDTWFTELADELSRCLTDAEACAEACEVALETARADGDAELQRRAVAALVAPAAISRVLLDLVDHPPQLVLAAARLLRDSAQAAIAALGTLDDRIAAPSLLPALRAVGDSCERLLDAA